MFLDGVRDFCLLRGRIGKRKAAAKAPTARLALVDSDQYGESWFQAASVFRSSGVEGAMDEHDALGASSSWQHGNAASEREVYYQSVEVAAGGQE